MGMGDQSGHGAVALPEQIAHFRILSLLGEGAAGRVYLAEEPELRRRVALKVLRAAALSANALQRFIREGELLASLEHPGIARLYAAGMASTTHGDLPWLAMEYVPGADLLSYVRMARLDTRARLSLLAQVCAAVQFAHGRGIVHRDLKPGNILVDAGGRPRVLDFGVAHVVRDELADGMTVAGQVFGTLPYMSPEQMLGAPCGPASDVYSLGVIAYELLSGSLPYPALSNSTVIEALRIVGERRPERLSKRLPAARGDLETVVAKAMAEEPEQRYPSAAALEDDIRRLMSYRPIEARRPTAAYVLRLFVRRNKALALGLGFGVAALLVATVVSLNFALLEARALKLAQSRTDELTAINHFLDGMLTSADPANSRGHELTVREALDAAHVQLRSDASLSPSARASLATTLARTYLSLAEVGQALEVAHAERVRAAASLGAEALATQHLLVAEADALMHLGKFSEATALVRPVLDGSQPELRRLRFQARQLAATELFYTGQLQRSAGQFEHLYIDAQRFLKPDDGLRFAIGQDYCTVLFNSGQHVAAMQAYDALIEDATRELGADHPRTLFSKMDRAERLRELGRFDEAEQAIRPVLADRRRVSGPDRYPTLLAEYVLAKILNRTGRHAEAWPLIRHAAAKLREGVGDANPDTLIALNLLADVSRNLGALEQAEAQFRELIALSGESESESLAESLSSWLGLGQTLGAQGRIEEAVALYESALERSVEGRGAHRARLLGGYGDALMLTPRIDEAIAAMEQAVAGLERDLGASHPDTVERRDALQAAYRRAGLASGLTQR